MRQKRFAAEEKMIVGHFDPSTSKHLHCPGASAGESALRHRYSLGKLLPESHRLSCATSGMGLTPA